MPKQRLRWGLPILLGAVLRLYDLGGQSYWTDEAISIQVSKWPTSKLFAYFQVDPHPPLFYMLVKLWSIAGVDEFWMRLISALAGMATILILTILAKKIYDETIAFLAGTLMAINPLLIYVSQELRAMALAGFFIALAFWGWQRMQEDGRKGRIAAILGLTLAFYTHYYALFAIPVFFLSSRIARRSAAIALIAFVPWLFFLVKQVSAAEVYRSKSILWRDMVETILYANAGHFPWSWPTWTGLLSHFLVHNFQIYLVLALILTLPIFVLSYLEISNRFYVGKWFYLAAAVVLFAARYFPIFSPKYLAPFYPFLLISGAAGCIALYRRFPLAGKIFMVLLVLTPSVNLIDHYFNPAIRKTPWREALPTLTKNFGPADRILFYSATEAADVRFYLPKDIPTVDLWPDYQTSTKNNLSSVQVKLSALDSDKIKRVVLVDLNGALYRDTRQVANEWLSPSRGLPVIRELQPTMQARWYAWGPVTRLSSSP